ncbi:MAG: Ribosome hibernation promoting factor [Phycisphaerae bacterium]|nr:Ribosome hibernation promoting factor [Phycisphaerae bacterium]
MQVRISGRHIGVSDAVKQYCQDKAERLTRFYDRIQSIEVVLDGKPGQHSAELIVHVDGSDPFVANEQHADLHAAVDLVLEKVERQLTRHKERHRNRKHMPPDEGH